MVTLTLDTASDPNQGKYILEAKEMTPQEEFRLAGAVERLRGLIRSAPIVMPIVKLTVDGDSVQTQRHGGALTDEKQIVATRARLEAVLDGFLAEQANPRG